MQNKVEFIISNTDSLKTNILSWSSAFNQFAYFDSNNYTDNIPNSYDLLVAVASTSSICLDKENKAFDKLQSYYNDNKNWLFGFLSYDLKNDTEKLQSNNNDTLNFPVLHFFVPKYVFELKNNVLIISSNNNKHDIEKIFAEIVNQNKTNETKDYKIEFDASITKEEYLNKIGILKEHIQQGDIYEINFCQEFHANNVTINPLSLYKKLNKISPVPFSAFYKFDNKYLISASPERFVKKLGNRVISQPIKGTAKRGKDKQEDTALISELKSNTKERAENVMIVDLVRNDLSKIAEKNSVKVSELCGVYTYPQVHQMISTVEAKVSDKTNPVEIIKQLFPMGSMTGAPKIRAMQLIEKHEECKRGLFSGTLGYIKPNGDFDFNVIIRSLFYNQQKKHLSFQVGGAITIKSDANLEYEECFVKAKAIIEATNSTM